jgi:hypothetical protein
MDCIECGASLPPDARFCLKCGARVDTQRDTAADPLREVLERAIGFQYRIERLLGRGGMGAVYLAHELALERDVAIKVLPPEQAGTRLLRERFRREARTAARLTHPNIVPLYTFGEVNGLMYFVMGYIPGESLAARLQRDGPLDSDEARGFILDLTDALDYAHQRGVVHRDLKPDNILIDDESGCPMLTDFGIAKSAFGDGELTSTGQIVGTVHYMSPEQALGRADIDARSDLYSLGVVAFEMLSGQRPFKAQSTMEALTQRLTQPPPPLRSVAPRAADDLVQVIDRCLQRDVADRWPDARSVRAALNPSEDDVGEALAVRLLRISTALLVISALAALVLAGTIGPAAAVGLLGGATVPFLTIALGAGVVLKRQRMALRDILFSAVRQPRWWRLWYPAVFRRRGDVWHRLPPLLRRVRIEHTLLVAVMITTLISAAVAGFLMGMPEARLAPALVALAAVPPMFLERRRAIRYVTSSLGVTALEASRLLSTPTCRTSVWLRPPASALLQPGTPNGTSRPATERRARVTTPSPVVAHDDEVTRI